MSLDLRADRKRANRVLVPNENTDAPNHRKKKNSDVNKEHVCPYVGCTKRFNRPYRLDQHITARHTLEKKFPCLEFDCERTYASKYKLHLHLKNYHGSKVLENLSEASKTETNIELNTTNRKINGVNKEIQVDYCKNVVIKIVNPTVPCQQHGCSKIFSSIFAMRKHFKVYHVGPKKNSFVCDSCKSKFKSRSSMKEHWLCHLKILPFQCPVCNKSFAQKRYLRKHSSAHAKFTCPEVQCSGLGPFIGKPAYNEHIAQHHTELECCHCNEKFQSKFLLARHVKVHLKPLLLGGPFSCPTCQKTYSLVRNLNEHIRVKHDGQRVVCMQCGLLFVNAQKLKMHMKLHEPGYIAVRKVPKGAHRKQRKDAGLHRKTVSETILQTILPISDT